jgi:hypothetical protein
MKRMLELLALAFAASTLLLASSLNTGAQEGQRRSQVEKASAVPRRPVHTFSIKEEIALRTTLGSLLFPKHYWHARPPCSFLL